MSKIFVGSRLRRLRREHKHTQAQMAQAIGVSTAYVNLIENNQRSLSVQVLMAISDAYAVDWRDLIRDDGDRLLADLRSACQDPLFATDSPDIQELRAAVDHAPVLVEHFLRLYRSHHYAIDRMTRHGDASTAVPETAESTLHDFFRRFPPAFF